MRLAVPRTPCDRSTRAFLLASRPSGCGAGVRFGVRRVNGEDAVVVTDGDELDGVVFLTVEPTEDGHRITAVPGIRNPEKLHAV